MNQKRVEHGVFGQIAWRDAEYSRSTKKGFDVVYDFRNRLGFEHFAHGLKRRKRNGAALADLVRKPEEAVDGIDCDGDWLVFFSLRQPLANCAVFVQNGVI